jgi:superfamily II DNA or RNA helicase
MKLRPYQLSALDAIRRHYGLGTKKVLLHLATGAGKTLIFCQILKAAYQKGTRCLMVVRGKQLVDQASRRLEAEGVPHGVMQADHWRRMPSELIQVCSIDTLYRRKLVPKADLIVIDEAHLATSESYMWLIEKYPDAFFLPVSATPHTKRGLRHIAEAVVYPISLKDLTEQGYLVPASYYIPSNPDLSDVEIDRKTHDYKTEQLAAKMKSTVIYGHILDAWKRYGQGRPTLAFGVTIEHSLELATMFNAAGIPAAHIEADTPMSERQRLIMQLESGELKVLCNVGVLTTGVDIPRVSCIIIARPTKSYNLYIQILGRGTRIDEGKNDFIVLDHGGCVIEHGFIEDERPCNLDGKPARPKENFLVRCPVCFHAWNPIEQFRQMFPGVDRVGRDYICRAEFQGQMCGTDVTPGKAESETRHEVIQDENFEMLEVKTKDELQVIQLQRWLEGKIRVMRSKRYKTGWVFYQLRDKYGDSVATNIWEKIKDQI